MGSVSREKERKKYKDAEQEKKIEKSIIRERSLEKDERDRNQPRSSEQKRLGVKARLGKRPAEFENHQINRKEDDNTLRGNNENCGASKKSKSSPVKDKDSLY